MYRKILVASSAMVALCLSAQAETSIWKVDPKHTSASFTVQHMMISNVKGDFHKVTGVVHYDGMNLKDADVEVVIPVDSVDTQEPQRDAHLKSPDFFDSAKYPTITFKSKKITKGADGNNIMIGDLTIHGVTKLVTLNLQDISKPIKDPQGNIRIGANASTKVNRKDFGINFNKTLDNGGTLVGDDVAINIDVELIKQATQTPAVSSKTN